MHKPILQSMTNKLMAVMINMIIVPKNCGTALEKTRSNAVQSPIMVEVKSDKSLCPKKESGSFLSFSASVILRDALSE